MKKYAGFIYEWTNKLNNKKYIGAHNGKDDDGYVGGGAEFRQDIKTFGLVNFERNILEYVEDASKIKDRENYYLNLVNAAENSDYYNKTNKSSGLRHKKQVEQPTRKLCNACQQKMCAVNYTDSYGIIHYRSRCDNCIKRNKKIKPPEPRWKLNGYKKKSTCDLCNFRARYSAQLLVCHIDGNLNNNMPRNLKTICQNCCIEVKRSNLPWQAGDLEPDF
jgi:GIY-YIG catalytic domain